MAVKGGKIVSGYAQMWSRQIFDIKESRETIIGLNEGVLAEPGVYVLYRDDQPHYIGMTTRSLFDRIWQHANFPKDRYCNFWNFFSAFVVRDIKHIGQIEGILIAAIPTANYANPNIKRINIPPTVNAVLKKLRAQAAEFVMQTKAVAT
jgi:hypothetical protein